MIFKHSESIKQILEIYKEFIFEKRNWMGLDKLILPIELRKKDASQPGTKLFIINIQISDD